MIPGVPALDRLGESPPSGVPELLSRCQRIRRVAEPLPRHPIRPSSQSVAPVYRCMTARPETNSSERFRSESHHLEEDGRARSSQAAVGRARARPTVACGTCDQTRTWPTSRSRIAGESDAVVFGSFAKCLVKYMCEIGIWQPRETSNLVLDPNPHGRMAHQGLH